MLSHIVRKNKLFRALCMMMLLLIHLDAYAYEVISACHVDTQDEMAIPSAADTFQEEDVNVLEWEDLSYAFFFLVVYIRFASFIFHLLSKLYC